VCALGFRQRRRRADGRSRHPIARGAQRRARQDRCMTGWAGLERELDRWHAQGQPATLWLRDDDACRDTPALRRLLTLASSHGIPVAIAVIPATLDATLADALSRCREATLVQHGYAHRNHASADERSAELGDGRGVDV